jgi:cyclopropane fatty-acyl-phospholipid synthase-like methyltransferase
MENKNFTKEFFQKAWGPEGYYENFNYGLGIEAVCEVALYPFLSIDKKALEIGCGGGVFTERMIGKFKNLTAIDVIQQPVKFKEFENFKYIELPNQNFECKGVPANSIDFCFSYNVFCHISNEGLTEYLTSVNRVIKKGGDFVFMIANFNHSKKHFPNEANQFKIGDMLPIGHFYQSEDTLNIIADLNKWEVINSNLLPEHRDIVIHLKKK